MQIKIASRGTEITEPLRDYVHEKVAKLEHFLSHIQKVEVVLDARSTDDVDRRQVAEFKIWVGGLKFIQAIEAGRDMYAAIDLALEEAKRQLQKYKEKHVEEQRRKAEKAKEASHAAALQGNGSDQEKEALLVKVNRFASKPMKYQEAEDELKVLEQDFMVFRNLDTKEVNVLRKIEGKNELLSAENEMSPEEAISHLDRSRQNLVFFKNPATRKPSVIFRRKTGNYGLIEPEF